jgi:hypothetical protein
VLVKLDTSTRKGDKWWDGRWLLSRACGSRDVVATANLSQETPGWDESRYSCHDLALSNLGRVRTTQNPPESRYGERGLAENAWTITRELRSLNSVGILQFAR